MLGLLCGRSVATTSANCVLQPAANFRQIDVRNKIKFERQVWRTTDNSVLAFTSPLNINTDGASMSYPALHNYPTLTDLPPRFNIVCNGVTLTLPNGRKISHRDKGGCDRINWEVIRMGTKPDAWVRSATDSRINWIAIETYDASGVIKPCVNGNYYVSTTSSFARPKRADGREWEKCDQRKWLDANEIPAIVIPEKSLFISKYDVRSGDAVVLFAPASGEHAERIVFAIVGDTGPADKLGEATLAAHAALLGGIRLDPSRFGKVKVTEAVSAYAFKGSVVSLVFPRSHPLDGIHDSAALNADREKLMLANTLGGGNLDAGIDILRICSEVLK